MYHLISYFNTLLTTVLPPADEEFNYQATGPIAAETEVTDIFSSASGWLTSFIGIVAVIFLIFGGIQYASALGDEEKLDKAKRTIKYAIVGVVLASIAYLIVPAIAKLFQ